MRNHRSLPRGPPMESGPSARLLRGLRRRSPGGAEAARHQGSVRPGQKGRGRPGRLGRVPAAGRSHYRQPRFDHAGGGGRRDSSRLVEGGETVRGGRATGRWTVSQPTVPYRAGEPFTGAELHYRNLRHLGQGDVIMASIGGTGQTMVGNILRELSLVYIDLGRDEIQEDGSVALAT